MSGVIIDYLAALRGDYQLGVLITGAVQIIPILAFRTTNCTATLEYPPNVGCQFYAVLDFFNLDLIDDPLHQIAGRFNVSANSSQPLLRIMPKLNPVIWKFCLHYEGDTRTAFPNMLRR